MKILSFFIFFISSFTSHTVFGQRIMKTQIQNDILKSGIVEFIRKKKESNSDFNNIGYIEVNQLVFYKNARAKEVKYEFGIADQYYRPKYRMPSFYTYIENKLVFIYTDEIFNQNVKKRTKTQRHVDKLIKPYLQKPMKLKWRDKDGNVKIDNHFRDESINIHGGKTLIIYGDNSFVIKNSYPK